MVHRGKVKFVTDYDTLLGSVQLLDEDDQVLETRVLNPDDISLLAERFRMDVEKADGAGAQGEQWVRSEGWRWLFSEQASRE